MEEDGWLDSIVVLKENLIYIIAVLVFKFSHRLVDFTFYHIEFHLKVTLAIC